jgi:hypothetical protein
VVRAAKFDVWFEHEYTYVDCRMIYLREHILGGAACAQARSKKTVRSICEKRPNLFRACHFWFASVSLTANDAAGRLQLDFSRKTEIWRRAPERKIQPGPEHSSARAFFLVRRSRRVMMPKPRQGRICAFEMTAREITDHSKLQLRETAPKPEIPGLFSPK